MAPIALDLVRVFRSSSFPALFECSDDFQYVVKSNSPNRRLAAELIVSRLGESIGAPVAHVEPVFVDPDLIDKELRSVAFAPGLGSGSRFIPDCADADGVAHRNVPENHDRYLLLAVLYGWTGALDHQFIYTKRENLVHSVDHGYFLDEVYRYAVQEYTPDLEQGADVDALIARHFPFTRHQIDRAISELESVSEFHIRSIVAEVPPEWSLTHENRACLNRYLLGRRDAMLRKAKNSGEGLIQ